jgi:catechol 2,3-dioxygenase-like lactoylglutathione lyase family enzyme
MMAIDGIDHVNIRTTDVGATARFFVDVLDMKIRDTPGIPDRSKAAWLCDTEGRAVVHLITSDVVYPWERSGETADPGSGRIHHVALSCSGYDALCARLEKLGVAYNANAVPEAGLRQLFVEEPNGITLELNFFGA